MLTPIMITRYPSGQCEAFYPVEVAGVMASRWFTPEPAMVADLTFVFVRGKARSLLLLDTPPPAGKPSDNIGLYLQETAEALGISLPEPDPLTEEEQQVCREAYRAWAQGTATEPAIRASNPALHYQAVQAQAQGSSRDFFASNWPTLRRGGWSFVPGRTGDIIVPPRAGASSGRIPFRPATPAA